MFHPKKWKKVKPGRVWEVSGHNVILNHSGWGCDCSQDVFRLGGREQRECRHIRFVLRKERLIEDERKKQEMNFYLGR